MRRYAKRAAGALLGLAGGLTHVAVQAQLQTPLSTLDPAGPVAARVTSVWWAMLAGAGFAFVVTVLLAAIAILRRDRGSSRRPPRALLWGGGLAMPICAILALLAYTIHGGTAIRPIGGDNAFQVTVTAQQFRWTAQYPGGAPTGGVEENRVLIPTGRPVDVTGTSTDVIHGFWIPRLGGKVDTIPGRLTTVRLQADKPGVYRGVCAEFCGVWHARMIIEVEALDDAAFIAQFPQQARQLGMTPPQGNTP